MNEIIIPEIDLSQYDYSLSKEKIAYFPLEKREMSKLLLVNSENDEIGHYAFNEIENFIPSNSLMILNDTKVIQARLFFYKATGGKIELLLVEPQAPSTDPAVTLSAKSKCTWKCFIGGKHVREGLVLKNLENNILLTATVISREENTGQIEFSWPADISFSEMIKNKGKTPLPPYIVRKADSLDIERYQTVYAGADGSVAAPTAGLHFSENILNKLKNNGIKFTNITLHVGPGTFQPVENEDISKHNMHSEQIFITKENIDKLLTSIKEKDNIIAVGTTSVRTIESLYWFGLKLKQKKWNDSFLFVEQWEPYSYTEEELIAPEESVSEIISWMNENKITEIHGWTKIIIVPGYDFKYITGLLTNFHLPKSTLILLVSAFIGTKKWKLAYNAALENNYRFLSYGDSSLLFRKNE